jgi:S1-C subfamily serine protease
MRRFTLPLLMLLCLAACTPAPESLRLVTIESPETGLSLRELPQQTLRSLGLTYGLAVVRAGGFAERAGLKVGDVIYGVNQNRVNNLEEFNRLLAEQPGRRFGLLVRRAGRDFYVAVDLGAAPHPHAGPKGVQPPKDTLLRT